MVVLVLAPLEAADRCGEEQTFGVRMNWLSESSDGKLSDALLDILVFAEGRGDWWCNDGRERLATMSEVEQERNQTE